MGLLEAMSNSKVTNETKRVVLVHKSWEDYNKMWKEPRNYRY